MRLGRGIGKQILFYSQLCLRTYQIKCIWIVSRVGTL